MSLWWRSPLIWHGARLWLNLKGVKLSRKLPEGLVYPFERWGGGGRSTERGKSWPTLPVEEGSRTFRRQQKSPSRRVWPKEPNRPANWPPDWSQKVTKSLTRQYASICVNLWRFCLSNPSSSLNGPQSSRPTGWSSAGRESPGALMSGEGCSSQMSPRSSSSNRQIVKMIESGPVTKRKFPHLHSQASIENPGLGPYELRSTEWAACAALKANGEGSLLCWRDPREISAAYPQKNPRNWLDFAAQAFAWHVNGYFQQDGAPVHTSKVAIKWLENNFNSFWGKGVWPGNSPDLSPIENLWAIVQEELKKLPDRETLIKNVKTAWANISPDILDNLICCMPERIKKCIKVKGGYIGKWHGFLRFDNKLVWLRK